MCRRPGQAGLPWRVRLSAGLGFTCHHRGPIDRRTFGEWQPTTWRREDSEESVTSTKKRIGIVAVEDLIKNETTINSRDCIHRGEFPRSLAGPGTQELRGRCGRSVLCEALINAISEAQFQAMRIEFRNELNDVEDAKLRGGNYCRLSKALQ